MHFRKDVHSHRQLNASEQGLERSYCQVFQAQYAFPVDPNHIHEMENTHYRKGGK